MLKTDLTIQSEYNDCLQVVIDIIGMQLPALPGYRILDRR